MDNKVIKLEVEKIVSNTGSNIEEWLNENCFTDQHGCDGYIFKNKEDAKNSILYGDEHQNAIDMVKSSLSDKEWIDYLINAKVEPNLAKSIIKNQQWDKVVKIIVNKSGPEWFLSSYSGKIWHLSDGSLLYY